VVLAQELARLFDVHNSEKHALDRGTNDAIAADDRVECVMLTIRDGISLIRRR
jgi:hypothetical protein